MIDLYYWPTPNGWKITIFLEEAALDYNVIPVDIGKGDQFDADYLKIGPNNRMPMIRRLADNDIVAQPPGWLLIDQIELRAPCNNRLNAICPQPSADRGPDQPLMTGDKNFAHNPGFLLVIVKGLIASPFDQCVTLRGFMIGRDHFLNQRRKRGPRLPTQLCLRL